MSDKNLLTHSRVSSWKRCPRKHQLEYELGIRRQTEHQALRFGSAVHESLDLSAQGKSEQEIIAFLNSNYDEKNRPECVGAYEWQIERIKALCLVVSYIQLWDDSEIEFVATEQSFDVPLKNPETGKSSRTFRLAGKIDKVFKKDGALYIREHKTTSSSIEAGSEYWSRLSLDGQISTYLYAARELGYDIVEVEYDVIKKPTIGPLSVPIKDENGFKVVLDEQGERVFLENGKPRQSGDTKKGWKLETTLQTPDEYKERLWNDIQSDPGRYFQRKMIGRTQQDIALWMRDLWKTARNIRESQNDGHWVPNAQSCLHPQCPFTNICFNDFDFESGELPSGYIRLENVHPELEECNDAT